MKKWLNECNEEGVSNGDALYMGIVVFIAMILPFVLYRICG